MCVLINMKHVCASLWGFSCPFMNRRPQKILSRSLGLTGMRQIGRQMEAVPMVGWLHHGPGINQSVASREGKTLVLPQGLAHELLWMF